MNSLDLPEGFPFPQLITSLSPNDTIPDGSADNYLRPGLAVLDAIGAALAGAEEPRRILDLQCSYGQVTRALRARYPRAEIAVWDQDEAALGFSAAVFGATAVAPAARLADLDLGAFDVIWAGSLLSQLPESETRLFFDFASRHLGSKGCLLLASNGDHVATRLRTHSDGLEAATVAGLLLDVLSRGYGFRAGGDGRQGGVSIIDRAWYEALFDGSPLRIQAFVPRGWDRRQDILILERAPQTPLPGPAAAFTQAGLAAPLPPDVQAARDQAGHAGFDEDFYRATYPDVAAAVDAGIMPSAFAHYRDFGWREARHPFDPALSYAKRHQPRPQAWVGGVIGGANRVSEAWSTSPEEQAVDLGWYWLAHPSVRNRTNVLASGRADRDAYDRLVAVAKDRGGRLPFGHAISIGCGFGGLERDLAKRGLVGTVDAYDIAAGAIAEATRLAAKEGLTGLRYHVADLDSIDLPPQSVDAVFAHSSVHHVERLEALYAVVQRTLRPGGIFHLHEFVGPTRFQWTDEQLRLANDFLDSLPPRLRQLPDGLPKGVLRRPTIEEMIAADPSESVRSAELVPALEAYFDIIEIRPLGGTLSHLALGGIAQNFDPASPADEAVLRRLFEMEDAAMAAGSIGSDFATVTAVPKPL